MSFEQFSFWLLTGMLALTAVGVARFLQELLEKIESVREEMHKLNEKIGSVITNQEWYEKEIAKIDLRITNLEKKCPCFRDK